MPKDYANRKIKPGTGKRKNPFTTRQRERQVRTLRSPTTGVFSLTSFSAGLVLGMAATILSIYVMEITKPIKPANDLPKSIDQGLPHFDFYNLLPNAKVLPDTEPYATEKPDHDKEKEYFLQAASFRFQRDADELRASLILVGLNASTTEISVNEKLWYRVIVGPFKTKRETQRAITQLRERNIPAILLYRTSPAG